MPVAPFLQYDVFLGCIIPNSIAYNERNFSYIPIIERQELAHLDSIVLVIQHTIFRHIVNGDARLIFTVE